MENECTDCEGGGVIYRRDKYGDLLDDMSCDPCKTCNGTGVIEIEPEPTELRDNAAAVLWSGRHTNQREVEELAKELLNTIDRLTAELKAKDKRIEVLKELICTECGSDACSTKAGCPFEQALKGE